MWEISVSDRGEKKTTAELSAQRVIESPPSARRPAFEEGQISLQQKARKAFSLWNLTVKQATSFMIAKSAPLHISESFLNSRLKNKNPHGTKRKKKIIHVYKFNTVQCCKYTSYALFFQSQLWVDRGLILHKDSWQNVLLKRWWGEVKMSVWCSGVGRSDVETGNYHSLDHARGVQARTSLSRKKVPPPKGGGTSGIWGRGRDWGREGEVVFSS